jgi:hypothetical protein
MTVRGDNMSFRFRVFILREWKVDTIGCFRLLMPGQTWPEAGVRYEIDVNYPID